MLRGLSHRSSCDILQCPCLFPRILDVLLRHKEVMHQQRQKKESLFLILIVGVGWCQIVEGDMEDVITEVAMLRGLSHPLLVRFYGLCASDEGTIYIVSVSSMVVIVAYK
jgi:hypothetical protein